MNTHLQNLLIARIADLLVGSQHVAVGASSPIPAAGTLLASYLNPALRVSLLGSETHTAFTDGGRELFDCAAQGRIDTFFFSGVQIDSNANINLVGTGNYPQLDKRYSGSFGSAYLYHLVPKVILFCWAHRTTTLVDKVDFISAAGPRDDGVFRTGKPVVLLTDRCEFSYQDATRHFQLQSLHPGETIESIADNTALHYEPLQAGSAEASPSVAPVTSPQTLADIDVAAILDQEVLPQLASTYPRFVERYYQNPDS